MEDLSQLRITVTGHVATLTLASPPVNASKQVRRACRARAGAKEWLGRQRAAGNLRLNRDIRSVVQKSAFAETRHSPVHGTSDRAAPTRCHSKWPRRPCGSQARRQLSWIRSPFAPKSPRYRPARFPQVADSRLKPGVAEDQSSRRWEKWSLLMSTSTRCTFAASARMAFMRAASRKMSPPPPSTWA